jgi:hypothetical protein
VAERLTEEEVARFLRDVEEGRVVLTPDREPQDIYAGNVEYWASNSWRVVVFNDCNQWDYIDQLVAPDGRLVEFEDIEQWPGLADYSPSDEVAWSRYRIPGYMQFRCTECGRGLVFADSLELVTRGRGDFRCLNCSPSGQHPRSS